MPSRTTAPCARGGQPLIRASQPNGVVCKWRLQARDDYGFNDNQVAELYVCLIVPAYAPCSPCSPCCCLFFSPRFALQPERPASRCCSARAALVRSPPTAPPYHASLCLDLPLRYENCPSACKQCSFNNCNDDSTFSDYFSYSCSDWGSWDCSTAHTKYDYSDIQTQLLLKNCPKTCHVCGDLSDPACVYPFVYEGGKHHSSVARNGHRECLTRHGLWKVAIPSGTPCVRAYIFEGVSYTGCTTAGTHGDYAWCPTKVDPETLEPVDGHWSVCQDCNLASTLPIEDCHVTTSPTHSPTSTAPSKSPSPPPTPMPPSPSASRQSRRSRQVSSCKYRSATQQWRQSGRPSKASRSGAR